MVAQTTPMPAQVILCLGDQLPGIGAEFTLAPAIKALNTQPVGGGMVMVEMTLTFVVRLVPTDSIPAPVSAIAEPATTPVVAQGVRNRPGGTPAFGNGSLVNLQNETEVLNYNNFIKIKGSPPESRGQLTQWLSTYADGSNVDFNKKGDVDAFNDHVRLEGYPPASREALVQWVIQLKSRQVSTDLPRKEPDDGK